MSWYKRGDSEVKKELEKREKLREALKEKSAPWFRLKNGEEGAVIMIDDNPFFCEVHTVRIGGYWKNITCSAGVRPCPICLQESKRPQPVAFFTVLDLRPFKRDDGTVSKYRKALLPAKAELAGQLLDLKEKYGTLKGCKIVLKRYSDRSPACGVVKELVMKNGKPARFNVSSLGKEFATPFDYEKLLAPPTDEELEYMGYPVTPIVGDTPIEEAIEEEIETEPEETDIDEIVEPEEPKESEPEEELEPKETNNEIENLIEEEEEEGEETDTGIEDLIETEEPKPVKKPRKKK